MTIAPAATLFADVPDPLLAPPLNWGILGAGNIAGTFAHAVAAGTRSQVLAVGSRDQGRGELFAAAHGIPTTHVGYQALVADETLDAIYIATPHSEHRDQALLAIAAGKHVLVEKSFTRNAAQAQEVFDAAAEAGVFVMEAMWTRFLPHIAALRSVIASGVIGDVVTVLADHGQAFPFNASSRLFAPELAGGALLDLGVYPVSFAHDILGAPDGVHAVGSLTETGVDGQITIALTYGAHAHAALSTTLWGRTPTTASITGTLGAIEVGGSFYVPSSITVTTTAGARWTYDQPVVGGFQYQIAEVARCVETGVTQSERMPWSETLAVLRTMDEIRAQIGVTFPGE